MKRKPFAVAGLLAILLCNSCSWFHKPTSLNGDWRIDSFHISKDANAIGYLLLAMNKRDSSLADLSFRQDSLVFYTDDGNEKIPYHLTRTNELILQDSTNEHFYILRKSDSVIAIQSQDSSVLYLRKM